MEEGGGGERGGGGMQEEVQVSVGKVSFSQTLVWDEIFLYILDIQLEFYLMSNSSLPDYCCRFLKICVALL